MDVREKLVELLNGIIDGGFKWHSYGYESGEQLNNDEIASHLIAHGVTVQEWISVNEKPMPEGNEEYEVCCNYRGEKRIEIHKGWNTHCVTHWRKLPKPPKGE